MFKGKCDSKVIKAIKVNVEHSILTKIKNYRPYHVRTMNLLG